MYSRGIEHVLMHLWKMRTEVEAKIEKAHPNSNVYRNGKKFLDRLQHVQDTTRTFWIDTCELSIWRDPNKKESRR